MPTINTTTGQGGYLQQSRAASVVTWDDTLNSFSNASSIDLNATYTYTYAEYFPSFRSPLWRSRRSYLVFDTSAITGTLTDIALNIYVHFIDATDFIPDMIIESCQTPTLTTALATSDWPQTSNGIVYAATSLGSNTWQTLTLNSNGLSIAEVNNEMTLWLRDAFYDYYYPSNVLDPPGIGYIQYRHNYASFIPYLDYTMITGYGQIVNGIIPANIGKVDGVSKASISKVLGV
jgi:hypothetical protein